MSNEDKVFPRMNRRDAIKWMFGASAALAVARKLPGATPPATSNTAPVPVAQPAAQAKPATAHAVGYGTDPDVIKLYQPGDFWPLTFTPAQHKTVSILCATIIPADETSPSAAEVGVPDFIDEWISAPYPEQQKDRDLLLAGIQWLDTESTQRFGKIFAELDESQIHAICDDICYAPNARLGYGQAAEFFKRFRDLTAGGFYTSAAGMKDIRYVGNVPLPSFDGPPIEALKQVGLA